MPPPGPQTRRAYALGALVLVGVHGAHALTGAGPDGPIEDGVYLAMFAATVLACVRRARATRAPGPWWLAAAGVTSWGAAELSLRLAEPDPRAWYPAGTQVLLLAGFALAYATLALLLRARVPRPDPVLALDGLVAGLGAAALVTALIARSVTDGAAAVPGADPQSLLVAALVPLVSVLAMLGLAGWRPGRMWSVLGAGIAINAGGQLALIVLVAEGTFHRGSVADTLFGASALLLGFAALQPAEARRPRRVRPPGTARIQLPLAGAAVALTLLVLAAARPLPAGVVALATATLLVALVRMSVALELGERNRRYALTDGLTGLGNRRALLATLGRRLSARDRGRWVLALLDLDGFKRYNDVFGHASGDAILGLLGERLREAAAPGRAFRMGGDEFCVLAECDGARPEALVERWRRALAEEGEGFAITASAGHVVLDRGRLDVSGALSAADARMYAEKIQIADLDARHTADILLQTLAEREPGLREHQREVARLAARVGRRLGLPAAEVELVGQVATLHDVGKIAVPDAILHKAGPLDAEEWRVMQRHAAVGERILRAAPALAPTADSVRACHERWDGRGYPDGLRGREIPRAARIVAACDSWVAMREHRPYRPARSAGQALAALAAEAGRQFEPAVVEALVAELRAAPGREPEAAAAAS